MASILCFTSAVNSITSLSKASSSTSGLSPKSNLPFRNPTHHGAVSRFQPLRVKQATESSTNSGTKRNSIVCADCDGNGAKLCTQCQGTGVNSVDHFNGRFKAGASCWLCRGKKEILCGNCNGAGFLGGFMSTFDETSG
ncbi:protein BUNDLE SHEATH DEFECTIVE 2, chloroplastic isoform X2 [Musa acuminata AAA Group]|uniref:protein BUNDLE SHEATH DEFECTIVE 2, chloroplastic isoform X2 n=1 Tax=Musa acuminata AAA Group TaxID=214697 RepID=UPI0031E29FE7